MESPFRKAKAKRAVATDRDSLKPTAMIDENVRGYISHGLLGLAISALGLAVAGGVALTGTAQATEVSTETTSMQAGAATRAEPIPQAQDIDRETQAERQAEDQPSEADDQPANSDGTLDRYGRDEGTSRTNPVRAELQKGVSQQKAKQRSTSLEDQGEDVSQTSRTAVQKSRSEQIAEQRKAVEAEQKRLEEEKRKAEEAKRAEEAKKGTLKKQEVAGYSAPVAPAAAAEPNGEVTGAGGSKPIARYTIAARWGAVGSWSRYHTGIDLSAPIGTPVMAAADGVVKPANGGGWAGIHVIIEHPGGGATLSAHLNSATVSPGQTVKAGQVIGYVGMTGRTFGPHLHFEYYPSASGTSNPYSTSDPYTWMLTKGVRL